MAIDRRLFLTVLQVAQFWNLLTGYLGAMSQLLLRIGRIQDSQIFTFLTGYAGRISRAIITWLKAQRMEGEA